MPEIQPLRQPSQRFSLGNTAIGEGAIQDNQTGSGNTAVGLGALQFNTASNNIAVGQHAGGGLTTGDSNIDIGNGGVAAEANTIRRNPVPAIDGEAATGHDAASPMITFLELGPLGEARWYRLLAVFPVQG